MTHLQSGYQRNKGKSCRARPVPLLETEHAQAYLKFAIEHMHNPEEHWENIL